MLTLINLEATPSFDSQAVADSTDWNAAGQGDNGIFILTGMAVSQHTGSDMNVSVAVGTYYIGAVPYVLAGTAVVAVGANSGGSGDRKDIVVAAQQGTLNATHTNGAGAITSIAVLSLPVAIPSGATLVMPNGDNVTTSAPAIATATSISINSYTPSTTITSGQPFTPLWTVAGTPCGTAGWTKTNASSLTTPPPVKPGIPSLTVLLSEVSVIGSSTTAITTSNLVDKTNVVGLAGQAIGNINIGGFSLQNTSSLLIGEATLETAHLTGSQIVGIEHIDNNTYTAGHEWVGIHLSESPTFTTTNVSGSSAVILADGDWTVNKINGLSQLGIMNLVTGFAGTASWVQLYGIFLGPQWGSSGTLTTLAGLILEPNANTGHVTTLYGAYVGAQTGSTIGTMIGIDIGVKLSFAGATTVWGLIVGNYNSYFAGLTTFGSSATPLYDVHLQGGNSAGNALGLSGSTTAPTTPVVALLSGGNVPISVHVGSGGVNTYLLIGPYDDAGTTRYKSLQLNGTGVTWVAGTSIPT